MTVLPQAKAQGETFTKNFINQEFVPNGMVSIRGQASVGKTLNFVHVFFLHIIPKQAKLSWRAEHWVCLHLHVTRRAVLRTHQSCVRSVHSAKLSEGESCVCIRV